MTLDSRGQRATLPPEAIMSIRGGDSGEVNNSVGYIMDAQ